MILNDIYIIYDNNYNILIFILCNIVSLHLIIPM